MLVVALGGVGIYLLTNGEKSFETDTVKVDGSLIGSIGIGGGAIYNDGEDNLDTAGIGGGTKSENGGAIYNSGDKITINGGEVTLNGDGTFSKNQESSGGAIYNDNGNVIIDVSDEFKNNKADQGGNGGAIYNDGAVNVRQNLVINSNGEFTDGAGGIVSGAIYNTAEEDTKVYGITTTFYTPAKNGNTSTTGTGSTIVKNGDTVQIDKSGKEIDYIELSIIRCFANGEYEPVVGDSETVYSVRLPNTLTWTLGDVLSTVKWTDDYFDGHEIETSYSCEWSDSRFGKFYTPRVCVHCADEIDYHNYWFYGVSLLVLFK